MNSDDDDNIWAPPNDTPARKNERVRQERQAREQARALTQTAAAANQTTPAPVDNGDDLYSSEDNYEDWIDRTPSGVLESQLAEQASKVRDTPAAATRRKKPAPTAALPAPNRVRPRCLLVALTRLDRPRSRTLSTRPRS